MIDRRKKPRDNFDYSRMRRAELISRLIACRDCFKKMSEHCLELKERLKKQSELRIHLHG